jgi:hypothetical protein
MLQVVAGFLLAPLIVAIISGGALALAFLIIMYLFELTFAVPLFLLFKKLGWLSWWHSTFAGLATAAIFVAFYWYSANPYHIEIYGLSNAISYLAIGTGSGLLFWLIALFRNTALPQSPPNWFVMSLALVAFATGAFGYHTHLKSSIMYGVVVEVPTDVSYIANLPVKLDSGPVVTARAMRDTVVHLARQRAVLLETRASALSSQRMFWVIGCRDNPLCT